MADPSRNKIERARLYATGQIAAILGESPGAIRQRIRRAGVPRCDWNGWEKERGPAVCGADYRDCVDGGTPFATDAKRRRFLERNGEITYDSKA